MSPNPDRKITRREADIELAVMGNDIQYIKTKVDSIERSMKHDYVTNDEFEPIKRLVYGLVGLILISVIVAILKIVIGD